MTTRGVKVRVRLIMEARIELDAESANVVGELRGRERPEEIVLLGGHFDSWDVGTGASDEILAFDPATRRFTAYPLPTRGALLRHLAIDEGRNEVWAAYGASPGTVPARRSRL